LQDSRQLGGDLRGRSGHGRKANTLDNKAHLSHPGPTGGEKTGPTGSASAENSRPHPGREAYRVREAKPLPQGKAPSAGRCEGGPLSLPQENFFVGILNVGPETRRKDPEGEVLAKRTEETAAREIKKKEGKKKGPGLDGQGVAPCKRQADLARGDLLGQRNQNKLRFPGRKNGGRGTTNASNAHERAERRAQVLSPRLLQVLLSHRRGSKNRMRERAGTSTRAKRKGSAMGN